MGQRAASPTFSRKTIRTWLNPSQMDSKMLLAQKARTINKSTREERQRLREAEKQLREKGRIAPIANEPMVGCKS